MGRVQHALRYVLSSVAASEFITFGHAYGFRRLGTVTQLEERGSVLGCLHEGFGGKGVSRKDPHNQPS
jgi:hypothetical protein